MKTIALPAILLALAAIHCAPAAASRAHDVPAAQGGAALTIDNWGSGVPGAVATWPAAPLEAGSANLVTVGLRNIGYGPDNSPVTLEVELPPGVSYLYTVNSIPSFTCTAAARGGSEVVTCVTPGMFDTQLGYVAFAILATPDLPVPGPVEFHAAIGNDVQPLRTDCRLDPHQLGCGRLSWATRPQRVPQLEFVSATVFPAVFTVGESGTVQLGLRNAGEGDAPATTVALRLPPGFTFANPGGSPWMGCSASGDAASGQTVTCTGGGLPSGFPGTLVFNPEVDAQVEVPGPVVVLAAIDTSNPPSTATLLACADDPSPAHCRWIEIPTFAPCAAQHADGIYCDGFEWLHPPARP